MEFWFGKRISLVDKVIEKAREMGGGIELTCCTFEMPQAAGVKLNRAVEEGILSHVTVYMEGGHRRKKNWCQAMIRMGWTIYNIPMHAKVAILEKPGRNEDIAVFLSSNNWQAGGNHEFIELIEEYCECMVVKLKMLEALGDLKPLEPV